MHYTDVQRPDYETKKYVTFRSKIRPIDSKYIGGTSPMKFCGLWKASALPI